MFFVDYHTHPCSHGENEVLPFHNIDRLRAFIRQAEQVGIKQIGFSDHEKYLEKYNWNNLKKICEETKIDVCIGIEIDYKNNRENEIRKLIEQYPFDYTIGSVHHLEDWNFDHPKYKNRYTNWNLDDLYNKYFEEVNRAISSQLFNIIGHLDLIKIFGHHLDDNKRLLEIVTPVLRQLKDKGQILEINTNGLNKPVKEIYPSLLILEKAAELNIPVTFGSDAHNPPRVGERISEVYKMINDLGYEKIATFKQGKMKLVNIKKR